MRVKKWCLLCLLMLMHNGLHDAKIVGEANVESRPESNLSAGDAIKKIKGHIDWLIKQTLPMILGASDELKLSKDCMSSIITLIADLKQMKDWAARMLDASSKVPSGILLGTTSGLGSYDECVDIVVKNKKTARNQESPSEKFRGQYCLVNIWPPKSLGQPIDVVANSSGLKDFNSTFWKVFPERSGFGERFRMALAICIPSTCSQNDLLKVATYATKPLGFGATINHCDMKTPLTFNNSQLAVMCIFILLLAIILVGTIFEAIISSHKYETKPEEKLSKNRFVSTLTAFSLLSNTKKFLNVYRADNRFGALAGIRFFSITWIILGHSYYFPHLMHYAKFKDMFTVTETQFDLTFMVIQNTALAVDSFFLVSGFLTTHSSLRRMKKTGGRLNAPMFFMKRIIRMLPAQFLVMGVLLLLPLFGSGPLWSVTWDEPISNCVSSWWSNILFIQNFWGLESMCLFHTWFLAVAMQLHIIAFFILIVLYRWPIFGIAFNVLLTVAGAIGVGLVTLFNGLPPTFSVETGDFPKFQDFYNYVYIQIYSHCGSYCIGVLLGYYITRKPDTKPKTVWRTVLWLLATTLGLATVYGLYAFTGGIWTRQSPIAHVLYAATFRTGWAIAVAWIVFESATRNESLINRILSWQPFAVMDRLTFMAYLLHPLIMYYSQARLRELLNTDYIDMIYYFLATTVITYMFSFFFHVAFEQPINYLDSVFFGGNSVSDSARPTAETCKDSSRIKESSTTLSNGDQHNRRHDFKNVYVVTPRGNARTS